MHWPSTSFTARSRSRMPRRRLDVVRVSNELMRPSNSQLQPASRRGDSEPDWLLAKIWLPKLRQTKILAAIWFATKIYQYLTIGMSNPWQIFLLKFWQLFLCQILGKENFVSQPIKPSDPSLTQTGSSSSSRWCPRQLLWASDPVLGTLAYQTKYRFF
jgi:hypothetical protein